MWRVRGYCTLNLKIANIYVNVCVYKSLQKMGRDRADILEGANLKFWVISQKSVAKTCMFGGLNLFCHPYFLGYQNFKKTYLSL